MKKIVENQTFDQERALYGLNGLEVKGCTFDGPQDGESAIKECSNVVVTGSQFNLRYPFWHVNNAVVKSCGFAPTCRAGFWYDDGLQMEDCKLMGTKALRECKNVALFNCEVNSAEFGWKTQNLSVKATSVVSEYPFFECENVAFDGLELNGKYSFQYVDGGEIANSNLTTKDAFWHSKNVTVKNCKVMGEYLGWYSENLHLINCEIYGTQPLCYCKGLVLENCTMTNTDLCFENSEVVATVKGSIDSVKNPVKGKIVADEIKEIIMEGKHGATSQCEIVCVKEKK